ncbi:MAG: glycoside hydrolase family 3 protein [Treponema sp.]|nr:glycoside hydrolase family 3 protein [Treponema sp.]
MSNPAVFYPDIPHHNILSNSKRRLYVLFSVLLLIFFPATLFSLNFSDSGSPEELAAALEGAMSDDQALAQTFMLGWVGAEPSPLIMDWIHKRNIGGVKIFGWNTDDTMRLARTVGALQEASLAGPFGIPLLMATDQEGGWIRHVKGSTSETPGNMAIGASGYPRDAYLSGYYIGKELAILGVNMDFAPAVDLFTNRDSVLIGPRAFGSDPANAGILGTAFMKGLLAAGVIPTAKHFPGHGDTDLDSHGILPRIDISFDVLWNRELVPYRMLSAEGLPAVMSGHLAFPKTEAGSAPASLSSWFLRTVLRDKIGFNGVIITDDLMMNGASMWAGGVSRAAKQALLAGNDIIMLSQTPNLFDPVWTTLAASMKTDPDFRLCVRAAARRVLELKLRYLRGDSAIPFIPDLRRVESELPDPDGSAFFMNLAARSVTVVSNKEETSVQTSGKQSAAGGTPQKSAGADSPVYTLPLKPGNAGRVLLAGQFSDFFKAGMAAYPAATTLHYTAGASGELLSYARNADTIIFCLSDAGDLRLLRSLESLKKRVIVLSVLNPVYIESVPWINAAIAVYSYAPESFTAGFSAIIGRINAGGKLPYE